eukprot:IDg17883t1
MRQLWTALSRKYVWSESLHDTILGLGVAFTKELFVIIVSSTALPSQQHRRCQTELATGIALLSSDDSPNIGATTALKEPAHHCSVCRATLSRVSYPIAPLDPAPTGRCAASLHTRRCAAAEREWSDSARARRACARQLRARRAAHNASSRRCIASPRNRALAS